MAFTNQRINTSAIFTVGHGNRTFEELIEILSNWKIETVVDIRSYPRSKRNPEFNQEILTDALPMEGIRYVWLKAMGGLRRKGLGKDSPHTALRREGFRNYADHMLTDEFGRAVREVKKFCEDGPTCLMCAETVPFRCHRWLVSDRLMAEGLTVAHLLDRNHSRPHKLSPHGRIESGSVFYDRIQPRQENFNFGS
jgi:uncharacterized protein (DUF488 family)